MVDNEYFYNKLSKKEKVKYLFKKHTIGLFKDRNKVMKENPNYLDQKEEIVNIIDETKNRSKVELKQLPQKENYNLITKNKDDRMTPPLLRDSFESTSESDSGSESDSKPYIIN
jgi:hypothetical protein